MAKTKIQIIDETEAAFSEAKNRGLTIVTEEIKKKGVYPLCTYDNGAGQRCAVGRCIDPAHDVKNLQGGVTYAFETQENLDKVLLPEYRGHPIQFWNNLQSLHDVNFHFKDGTWSPIGKQQIAYLKKVHAEEQVGDT